MTPCKVSKKRSKNALLINKIFVDPVEFLFFRIKNKNIRKIRQGIVPVRIKDI
jgi:hypothetical protein